MSFALCRRRELRSRRPIQHQSSLMETAGLFDTSWAAVTVCSLLKGMAEAIPAVTVKALILHHFGPHNTFVVNGLLEGARALMAFCFAPLVGRLSDSVGRRLPLAICVLAGVLPSTVLLVGALIKPNLSSTSWNVWSCFYVLCGAAKSTDAIITAYIVDVVPQRHRAGAMGINLAIAFGLSSALGNVSGTAVYKRWGTVPTFAVPVVLALLNVAYVATCLPESLKPEQRRTLHECSRCDGLAGLHPAAAFRLLRRDASGAMWRLCAAAFCAYASFFGFICNYQLYLQTAFGFTASDCAIFVAGFGLVSFCTKCSIGLLRTCLSEPALVRLGFSSFIAAALVMAAAPTHALFSSGAMLMAVGLIAPPVLAAIASTAEIELSSKEPAVGAVQALIVAFGALAEGVSPLAFGLLLDVAAGTDWPGLPFVAGGAIACFGWYCAAGAIARIGLPWNALGKPLLKLPVGLATPTGLR